MSVRPIIFEDHGWSRMRPLAWSTPVSEIRCGMFNLRERVETILESTVGGVNLVRPYLAPLLGVGASAGGGGRDVWLSGRLGSFWEVLRALLADDPNRPEFLWLDEQGMVAGCLDGELSQRLESSWRQWSEAAGQVVGEAPVDRWNPDQGTGPWRECAVAGGHRLLLRDPVSDQAGADELEGMWRGFHS